MLMMDLVTLVKTHKVNNKRMRRVMEMVLEILVRMKRSRKLKTMLHNKIRFRMMMMDLEISVRRIKEKLLLKKQLIRRKH